jgi:hypothetical protein
MSTPDLKAGPCTTMPLSGVTDTTVPHLRRDSVVRAAVLPGLAAVVLATHVFVDADRARVTVVEASSVAATNGVASVAVADPRINDLRPRFALTALITQQSNDLRLFSIAVDGVYICQRSVAGFTVRVGCAVNASAWSSRSAHTLAIKGPSTSWTLELLELASDHGIAGSVRALPTSSGGYTRPSMMWVVATWLALTALMLVLRPARLGRARPIYGLMAGLIVLLLTLLAVDLRLPRRALAAGVRNLFARAADATSVDAGSRRCAEDRR